MKSEQTGVMGQDEPVSMTIGSSPILDEAKIAGLDRGINSLKRSRFSCSLLERELKDQDLEELTHLTNSKCVTQHKILNESSKYKDPNLGQSNGLLRSKIKVACE